MTPEYSRWFADTFASLAGNVEQAVMGRSYVVRLALTCLLTEGHLLLEDVPGTGKTLLAKAIAHTVDGKDGRIQFTPDLLPGDVTGVDIYDQATQQFRFQPGPIFASVVLCDEINRASPKTQSALLQVMEESVVTVGGRGYPVGRPFMVIATQNPIEQAGTYRLPEAQLDRFLMKTSLGYPDHATTVALLAESGTRDRSAAIQPLIGAKQVADMASLASHVHVDQAVLSYVSSIAEATRSHPQLKLGLSVRGCLALVRAAKTWAAADGRNYVVSDDVKELAEPVLGHRVLLDADAEFAGVTVRDVLARILEQVRAPMVGAA